MKKIILMTATLLISVLSFSATPTEDVLKSFKTAFPLAKNVSWSVEGNTHVVYFVRGAEQFRLWYNAAGEIQQSIRYYKEPLLPPIIRSKVEKKFRDHTITSVTEFANHEGVVYFISLQDEKKWYQVAVDASGHVISRGPTYHKG